MSQSNSCRQSDFMILEDWNAANDMDEDIDRKNVGGENATSKEKVVGEVMSQLMDPQRHAEERIERGESEGEGERDSILDQELLELEGGDSRLDQEALELQRGDSTSDQDLSEPQEDDSILVYARTKHNNHDDCEDCKQAREEKRKRAIAREFQMRKIDADIKAAAGKVVESIEKDDPVRGRAANDRNDSILGIQKDGGYESEDHDDSLLSAQIDQSYERNLYNGQDETDLTSDTTKATLEDDGETEDEDSLPHHDLSSTDAEIERGYLGGGEMKGRYSSSNYGDVDDDVFSDDSAESPRFSVDSTEESPNRISASNRSSWQSHRQPDLSKEAQQLIELNSPIVGEEASTDPVISRIPSGISRASAPKARESSSSPRKVPRHPFRTPSDIRAMQMYSPTSSLFSTPHSAKRQQNPTVSRLGTPAGSQYSKSRTPTRFKKTREESPLVLLHVTVLPLQWQYSKAIVAPELPANLYNIREAYYLLQEKLSDTILTRGILLPHPQDSYECLEERFLDALELPVRPRAKILRCGHYIGPNTTSSDDDSADERDSGFGSTGRFKNRPEKVWCDICRRDVRYEDDDQDEDDKRFNIKIFASNGLMRAGAWAAAWKEMERVDVEIEPFVQPWMVEDMEDLIERLREAEERGRDDDYDQYSDDDSCGESLGSEAQRLHEQDLAKVTLRPKRGDVDSRNAREEWLVAASKAAEEEADRIAREDEALRQEEEAARIEEEEVRELEEEASRLHEEEEAQNFANLESLSSNVNKEDQTAEELGTEAQQLHEEDMAAVQALEEEAQRIHETEVAEQKALEEEAQRIFEAELAKEKELEEEARKVLKEEEVSTQAKEEESKGKFKDQENSNEDARLNDIDNKASIRNRDSSSNSISRTVPGDKSLSELLVKAARVVMRDRKNVLIILLSVTVLFLAFRPSHRREMVMPKYASDIIIQNHRYGVGQSVDQREYEQLRQAAAEGTLRMREIERSMGWNGQDVVITSSMKTQTPDMVQAGNAVDRQKQVVMEIDAPDVDPVIEKMEEVSQIATFERSKNIEAVSGTLSMSGTDIDVLSKDIPSLEIPSNPNQNIENLPVRATASKSHSGKLDVDTELDTSL